ncbi:MAG: class I SAM-dependent methyltransferase [Planctomycetota bacterium]|jgi:cyclopropane-fatty-acyl-phospholipid synthase
MSIIDNLSRRALGAQLDRITWGRVDIADNGSSRSFGNGDGPQVTIRVKDPRFYRSAAMGGSVGAAEAFMEGWWDTDNLTDLVRVLVRNREVMDEMEKGAARLAQPVRNLLHHIARNTREGSQRNIAAHYDLGNDFFRLFLDETLTYSCGIFEDEGSSLKEASEAKYDRICRKLKLGPDTHVVEIGCGWGGFALHAAGKYGARVTTTTISKEQHRLATERVREAGLDDRVEILRSDYRDLRGEYDRLVSIEMIEAVGDAFYAGYFEQCSRLLKPDGIATIQAITIRDNEYDRARREVDFIKRYIFPGSNIPSVARLLDAASKTDLTLFHFDDITPHYATTLRKWREAFFEHADEILAMGFDEAFLRMWDFYFCYCEGGFLERAIGDVQLTFTKPLSRREPIL